MSVSILKGRNLAGVGKGGTNVSQWSIRGRGQHMPVLLLCCYHSGVWWSSQLISPRTSASSILEQKMICRAISSVSFPPVAADLFQDILPTNLILLALVETGICPSNSHFASEYYQAQEPVPDSFSETDTDPEQELRRATGFQHGGNDSGPTPKPVCTWTITSLVPVLLQCQNIWDFIIRSGNRDHVIKQEPYFHSCG